MESQPSIYLKIVEKAKNLLTNASIKKQKKRPNFPC